MAAGPVLGELSTGQYGNLRAFQPGEQGMWKRGNLYVFMNFKGSCGTGQVLKGQGTPPLVFLPPEKGSGMAISQEVTV